MEQQQEELTQNDHDRFVAALEKHGPGSSGQEWQNMSHELQWTVDEVKIYAFRYMHSLHQYHQTHRYPHHNVDHVVDHGDDANDTDEVDEDEKDEDEDDEKDEEDEDERETKPPRNPLPPPPPPTRDECDGTEWSYQECILFDTLLAMHGPGLDRIRNKNRNLNDQRQICKSVQDMDEMMEEVHQEDDMRRDDMDEDWDEDEHGSRWERIAAMIPDKTSVQCRRRYFRHYVPAPSCSFQVSDGEDS